MTCWSTVEHWETALGLVTEGCIVLSDRMLISICDLLSVSCAKAADALTSQAGDPKPGDLLSPLMHVFKKLNLS